MNVLALTVVFLAIRRFKLSDLVISIILGLTWLWMGMVYHIAFFSSINPAAYVFGAFCILQGLLFFWGGFRRKLSYQATFGWRQSVGGAFVLYSLMIYPFLGMKFGHLFPAAPTFGAPCPTTIFTFGVFLWAIKLPRPLLIIPALWSIIGFTAALTLGIYEDIGLLVAGIIGTLIILFNDSSKETGSEV
ncbi:MAG: hypothetical protein EHM64_01765 [Ignavibacteriae bacterium]|nr:MAG: hypothetical protein EHM64_01765 [Ignavibacteriota bacterium]